MTPGPFPRLTFPEVVVLDTETTGLCPFGFKDDGTLSPDGLDRLCSVAALKLTRTPDGWVQSGEFHALTDPGRPIPEIAARVNGFTWVPGGPAEVDGRMNLAGQMPVQAAMQGLLAFIQDAAVVAHNIAFDASVLDAELQRMPHPMLLGPTLCTKQAFSDVQGKGRHHHYVPGTNLNALCTLLGVDRSSRLLPDGTEMHGALVDAALAARCFQILDAQGWMQVEDPATLPHRVQGRRI